MPRSDGMGKLCTVDCVLKGNPFVMPTSDNTVDCVLKGYPFVMPTSDDTVDCVLKGYPFVMAASERMGRLSTDRLPLCNAMK